MSGFLYMEIASTLRDRIARGDFGRGRLPSERDLTAEFGVQRATVRRALRELEEEGLVFRDATRGTFAFSSESAPSHGNGHAPDIDTGGIALIAGRASDTTAPGDIARGLGQAARERGRFLVWFDTPAAPGHAEAAVPEPKELLARGVVACVIWPEVPAPVERLRALRDAIPVVLLDRHVPGFESDFVGINDFAAGRMVTEHLLSVGHRRIGFVAVDPHASTVQERFRGWAAALAGAGITPAPSWSLHKNGDYGEADDPLLTRLVAGTEDGGGPITALVCTNDTVAAQVIRHLQRTGRRLGEEVAVTGFGNSFPVLLDALGLTTVAQPFEEMGRLAGEMLSARLDGEKPSGPVNGSLPNPYPGFRGWRERELPINLVVRRSCGANGIFSAHFEMQKGEP